MTKKTRPGLLDAVALLSARRKDKLARGQVGTIVELLDKTTALVEFADDNGSAFAIVPCALDNLIVLHSQPA
jgi:hypothetical protein